MSVLERIFVKEFFKNPFFYWSIILLVLTTFHSFGPINQVLQAIVIHSIYIPVLFACLILSLFLMVFPIRKSIKKLLNKKETQVEAIVNYSLIPLILIVHMYYFISDPLVIIAKLSSEVIIDKIQYKEATDLKLLFEYVGLPLFYAFGMTIIKNMIIKYKLPDNDLLKNNIKFGIIAIALGFVMYFLYVFVVSLQ